MDIVKVKITIENSDTGEERVVIDDRYRNIAYLADDYENPDKAAEVVIHTSISDLAFNMCGSEKFKAAARLSAVYETIKNENYT